VGGVIVRRALISVSDKTGLTGFARRLADAGVEIVSSGGTARHLVDAGIPVTYVDDVTGAPEMLGGRVKTLHPNIHGGILADLDDPAHLDDLAARGIEPFQLVVVNLYPFEEESSIEQIDIGGPTMIRAAAKNHANVAVVVSPDRYAEVAEAVGQGGPDAALRFRLASEAFARTATYDAAIASWFGTPPGVGHATPLRYGENPHQFAALFAERGADGWWRHADLLQGKPMSFNNYADAEAAWRLVADLDPPSAVIVKHTNACGSATRAALADALADAWECDPLAAFGGVVALNVPLDAETAASIANRFIEVVIAPSIDNDAAATLSTRQNLRVLAAPFPGSSDLDVRRIEGGYLVQERDSVTLDGDGLPESWSVAGKRKPTDEEIAGLRFAWTVAAHTKSNAIVIAKDLAAVGVGAGDQSRVGAAQRALVKAGRRAAGAVAASDGFFPFPDAVEALAGAGVTAIVEPGGSVKDESVIAAADEQDVAIVFTSRRHFLH
jgi:phosphoribosylaminoimidazolecarboxamide formyltransferase / IMP cyclohydrolase